MSRPASGLLLLIGPAILAAGLVTQWTSIDAADRSVTGLSDAYLITVWALLFAGVLALLVSVAFFASNTLAQRVVPLAASYLAAVTLGSLGAWLFIASVN